MNKIGVYRIESWIAYRERACLRAWRHRSGSDIAAGLGFGL
jgi:hypothetical protein